MGVDAEAAPRDGTAALRRSTMTTKDDGAPA
jgi:hypothetical protein